MRRIESPASSRVQHSRRVEPSSGRPSRAPKRATLLRATERARSSRSDRRDGIGASSGSSVADAALVPCVGRGASRAPPPERARLALLARLRVVTSVAPSRIRPRRVPLAGGGIESPSRLDFVAALHAVNSRAARAPAGSFSTRGSGRSLRSAGWWGGREHLAIPRTRRPGRSPGYGDHLRRAPIARRARRRVSH